MQLRRNGREGRVVADIAVEQPGGADVDAVVIKDGGLLVARDDLASPDIAAADEVELRMIQFAGHVILPLFARDHSLFTVDDERYSLWRIAAVTNVTMRNRPARTGDGAIRRAMAQWKDRLKKTPRHLGRGEVSGGSGVGRNHASTA